MEMGIRHEDPLTPFLFLIWSYSEGKGFGKAFGIQGGGQQMGLKWQYYNLEMTLSLWGKLFAEHVDMEMHSEMF